MRHSPDILVAAANKLKRGIIDLEKTMIFPHRMMVTLAPDDEALYQRYSHNKSRGATHWFLQQEGGPAAVQPPRGSSFFGSSFWWNKTAISALGLAEAGSCCMCYWDRPKACPRQDRRKFWVQFSDPQVKIMRIGKNGFSFVLAAEFDLLHRDARQCVYTRRWRMCPESRFMPCNRAIQGAPGPPQARPGPP